MSQSAINTSKYHQQHSQSSSKNINNPKQNQKTQYLKLRNFGTWQTRLTTSAVSNSNNNSNYFNNYHQTKEGGNGGQNAVIINSQQQQFNNFTSNNDPTSRQNRSDSHLLNISSVSAASQNSGTAGIQSFSPTSRLLTNTVVFDQYIKTLQSQINSRQSQRKELSKNIQMLQCQVKNVEAHYEKQLKRLANYTKQIEARVGNQKTLSDALSQLQSRIAHLESQLQLAHKNLESSQAQNFQIRKELQMLQQDYNSKTTDILEKLNQTRSQNNALKHQIQVQKNEVSRLFNHCTSVEKEIVQVKNQKTKIIQTTIYEKHIVEVEYENKKEQMGREINRLNEQLERQKSNSVKYTQAWNNQRDALKLSYQSLDTEKTKLEQINKALASQLSQLKSSLNQQQNTSQKQNFQVEMQVAQKKQQVAQLKSQILCLKNDIQSKNSENQQSKKTYCHQLQQLSEKLSSVEEDKQISERKAQKQNNQLKQKIDSLIQQTRFVIQQQKQQLKIQKKQHSQIITDKDGQILLLNQEIEKLKKQKQENDQFYKNEVKLRQIDFEQKHEKIKANIYQELQGKIQEIQNNYENGSVKQLNDQLIALQRQMEKMEKKFKVVEEQVKRQTEQKILMIQRNHRKSDKQKQDQIQTLSAKLTRLQQQKSDKLKHFDQAEESWKAQRKLFQEKIESLESDLSQNIQNHVQERQTLKNSFLHQIQHIKQTNVSICQNYKNELKLLKNQLVQSAQNYSNLLSQKNTELKVLNEKYKKSEQERYLVEQKLEKSDLQLKQRNQKFQKDYSQLLSDSKKNEGILKNQIQQIQKQYEEQIDRLKMEKSQLENNLVKIFSSVNSLHTFIGKYCPTLSSDKSKGIVKNMSQLQMCEHSRKYCDQISAFVHEKSTQQGNNNEKYLSIKVENEKLKKQLQCLSTEQITNLKRKLDNLNQTHEQTLRDMEQLKSKSDRSKSLQNQQDKEFKTTISSYKRKIESCQKEISKLTEKNSQKEKENNKNLTLIDKIQSRLKESQKALVQQNQNHQKEILRLRKVHQNKQNDLAQQKKQSQKSEIQGYVDKISFLQSELKLQKQKLSKAESKYRDRQKHIDDLQSHYQTQIQRLVQSYEKQLENMDSNHKQQLSSSQFHSNQVFLKRIRFLEQDVEQKYQEIRVLQENNKLLRKAIVSSLIKQEGLRKQLISTRSQHVRSKSRQTSGSSSLANSRVFKSKYLNHLNQTRSNGKMAKFGSSRKQDETFTDRKRYITQQGRQTERVLKRKSSQEQQQISYYSIQNQQSPSNQANNKRCYINKNDSQYTYQPDSFMQSESFVLPESYNSTKHHRSAYKPNQADQPVRGQEQESTKKHNDGTGIKAFQQEQEKRVPIDLKKMRKRNKVGVVHQHTFGQKRKNQDGGNKNRQKLAPSSSLINKSKYQEPQLIMRKQDEPSESKQSIQFAFYDDNSSYQAQTPASKLQQQLQNTLQDSRLGEKEKQSDTK